VTRAARGYVVAAAAAALLGISAACGACAPITSRVLLYPQGGELDLDGAERVMIAHEAGAIETIRAKSPAAQREPARAIVLRFYGNADRADRWVRGEAAGFGAWPVEVWGVNYPSYGRSEGALSLSGVARAADVAFAEAAKRGLPIFAMGTSMGTTAALHLASAEGRAKLRGLFLQNPPPLAQLIRGRYGWWNLWLIAGPISWGVPASLDSLANARKADVPVVLLSSERDEVVPFAYQTEIYEAYAGPKERIVVPGIGHNDPVPDEVWGRIRAALRAQGWGP
jgi:pimeloyl-ACP methyl ester carboxylesterase